MESMTHLGNSGRITVPARMRTAMGLQTGDQVVLRLENGTLRVIPLRVAVQVAQELVRKYVPEGLSLVDELIRARREEAALE